MLHWTPTPLVAFAGAGSAVALPAGRALPRSSRAEHARMLAHAAARRLRASGEDRAYWMKGAPTALANAAAIRAVGFPPLP